MTAQEKVMLAQNPCAFRSCPHHSSSTNPFISWGGKQNKETEQKAKSISVVQSFVIFFYFSSTVAIIIIAACVTCAVASMNEESVVLCHEH